MIRADLLGEREGQRIYASAPGHEHDFAVSAQAVDGKKHLVPGKIGAATHDLLEVARASVKQDIDHLIFSGNLLHHAPTC